MLMSTIAWQNLQGELDREESKIREYIHIQHPELEELFLQHLSRARRGILHRLLQAMIRENIADVADRTIWPEDRSYLEVQFSGGEILRAPVAARHTLGRFDLGEGPVTLRKSDGSEHLIEHPVQLLDLVKADVVQDDAGEKRFQRFREELQNSVANYALALAGAQVREQELRAKAELEGVTTAIEWAKLQAEVDPLFSPLSFFEQWVVEGHPLHPGAKIKMGLDVADVIRYSPEWGATPGVVLVAVRKDHCRFVSLDGRSPSEILFAEHAGLQAHVEYRLQEQGLNAADYELIPLHPWQFEHTLPNLYAEAIERREIVPIPSFRIRTQALMSFRTLAPVMRQGAGKHHIKTCVNVQTTGAVRTISPNSAFNGPTLTRILKEIQQREGHFGGKFVILEERVGVYYDPKDETLSHAERMNLGKNLASILRENPENHVRAGEISMPGSALIAKSPLSDKPIVGELIEQYAKRRDIVDLKAAAVQFLHSYAQIALPGFLTVMSRYGISLEGHLQNSVAVFRDGEPVRMILRDFGGVRILQSRLARLNLGAEFFPGSATVIDDVEDMRNKIYYPVFQNHFGELITEIARWLRMEERALWQPVAAVCRAVFAELKQDAAIAEQAAADEAALFEETIDLKAMATMRLLGDVTSYTFAKVPNPLAQV
jgi:siderophore synthetase component